MKSDLTCPVEVVSASVAQETGDENLVVCRIQFFNLSDKDVESLQMNIICFGDQGNRISGRLVRASVSGGPRERFEGSFMPDHAEGTSSVQASVEKVWFKDGVVWRREERNVREYTPNDLPEGRELDRLRAVAGADAVGYPREEDIVWLCVCGRANRTSDDACLRCGRDRARTLEAYSFAAIESTVGKKERELADKTQENVRRSSEQTAREVSREQKKIKKRARRVRRVIAALVGAVALLALARWGVPGAVCLFAQNRMDSGLAADARDLYRFVDAHWPGFMQAGERAERAEITIIEGMIRNGAPGMLTEAAQRARAVGGAEGAALAARATLDRAAQLAESGDAAQAEALLTALTEEQPDNEEAARALLSQIYAIAAAAAERVDYKTAIERFDSLGAFEDAPERARDCVYLYGRQLIRDKRYEQACEQLMRVAQEPEAVALIRQARYAWAQQLQEAGDYAAAAPLYESLGVYEESETRGRFCRYTAGMSALGEGRLEEAARQLELAEGYEDARERFADTVLTLGAAALAAQEYDAAIGWLQQLPREGEALDCLNKAIYARAALLEENGQREAASNEFASLGGYEDAAERANALQYAMAVEEMENSPEDAIARFEALGGYRDAAGQAQLCRYALAQRAYLAGEYEEALMLFEQLDDLNDSRAQARRCRYALGGRAYEAGDYDAAAAWFGACGAYLDAEERALRSRYAQADALETAGQVREAAAAFASLGSYEDAKARTAKNESAWLGAVYRDARMNMELGDYQAVVAALEDIRGEELPGRFADIPKMFETACLTRAQELIAANRPFDALPLLEKIKDNKQADKLLGAYVYRIVGRWKNRAGEEYVFRRDGTCRIVGQECYYGGKGYAIAVGDQPYPTGETYSVASLRAGVLSVKQTATGKSIRLTYVGEATPAPQEEPTAQEATPSEAAPAEDAQETEKE